MMMIKSGLKIQISDFIFGLFLVVFFHRALILKVNNFYCYRVIVIYKVIHQSKYDPIIKVSILGNRFCGQYTFIFIIYRNFTILYVIFKPLI